MWKKLMAGVVVLAAIAVAVVLSGGGDAPSGKEKGARPAPSFSAPVLGGSRQVSLASLRGHAVLLTSWATWCEVCRAELPEIEQLTRSRWGKGLRVVGVDLDSGSGEGAAEYAKAHGLTFLMLHDGSDRFQEKFDAVGVPTNVLVDARGRLVAVWPGALEPATALPAIRAAERAG
ncbi:MAG TPA: TlpA disulfide reductase family protein [Solirubrobacterales bacterium]|nr:TlpA disulfide reductase family protein [Solirubrobacterales bacterium]